MSLLQVLEKQNNAYREVSKGDMIIPCNWSVPRGAWSKKVAEEILVEND